MIHSKQHYLDLFGTGEPLLDTLVAESLRHGGDYCDLFFENTTYGNVVLRDGTVASGGRHIDYGVGIRVLCGEKTGYAYAESTAMPDLLESARAAAAIADGTSSFYEHSVRAEANGSRMVGRRFRGEPNPAADRYPVREHWRKAETDVFIAFLQKLEKAIRKKDLRIVKILANLAWQVTDVLMYNSLKELKYETRPMGSVSATVIFQQDGKTENKTVSRSFRTGVEMLSDALVEEMAGDAVKGIDDRFDARRPKGGQMPVVMGVGASGILLHEAMGHAFEADFNRKGTSIFSEKMGQQVCARGIHIIDDGTLKGNRGALNFDDEGVPAQKTYMVEDGILTSYLHDRISARHYGVSPTGNGRRESFRYAPIPRMRATYMESGDAAPEDIIASVPKGIYVDEFSNGQVQIGEGDFTFFVKSGFLIENGRLTAPVKDINIIGNGPAALRDIVAVGNDLAIDPGTWTCGKGQSVPVSCGIPTVLVKSLTVGGE